MTSGSYHTGGGLLLICDGFEEAATIDCLHTLRDAGMAMTLVGLAAGLVTGSRGITVQPDLSLDQLERDSAPWLVVIGGGRRCLKMVLADPRVHRLVQATAESGGTVAVMGTPSEDAETLLRVPLLSQGRLSVQEFTGRLLKLGG